MTYPNVEGIIAVFNVGSETDDFELLGEPTSRNERTVMAFHSPKLGLFLISTAAFNRYNCSTYTEGEVRTLGDNDLIAGVGRLAAVHCEATADELSGTSGRLAIPYPRPDKSS